MDAAPRAAAAALEPARNRGRFPSTAHSSITQPSPISTAAWITAPARTSTPSASRAPASTCACAETSATYPGARRSRPGRPARALERPLKLLQNANHPQPALAVRPGTIARPDAVDEVLAFDTQRLEVGDPGAPAAPG